MNRCLGASDVLEHQRPGNGATGAHVRSRRARRSPLQSVERSRNGCAAPDLARARQALLEDLGAIRQRWSAPPVLEARNADEIMAMTRAACRADYCAGPGSSWLGHKQPQLTR